MKDVGTNASLTLEKMMQYIDDCKIPSKPGTFTFTETAVDDGWMAEEVPPDTETSGVNVTFSVDPPPYIDDVQEYPAIKFPDPPVQWQMLTPKQQMKMQVKAMNMDSPFYGDEDEGNVNEQRTLILVKPDAVNRGLVGEIIGRFEKKGLTLIAAKTAQADQKLAEEHYAEHKGQKDYFESITTALTDGPVVALVLEGYKAIAATRSLIGHPRPIDSMPGTIRGDYGLVEPYTLVHGSDSRQAALREIKLWFGDDPLLDQK